MLQQNCSCTVQTGEAFLTPLNLKNDQYLISPYSNTTESFIEVMRIKDMITKLRSFNSQTNSLGLYHRKCIENSMENIDTDVWV